MKHRHLDGPCRAQPQVTKSFSRNPLSDHFRPPALNKPRPRACMHLGPRNVGSDEAPCHLNSELRQCHQGQLPQWEVDWLLGLRIAMRKASPLHGFEGSRNSVAHTCIKSCAHVRAFLRMYMRVCLCNLCRYQLIMSILYWLNCYNISNSARHVICARRRGLPTTNMLYPSAIFGLNHALAGGVCFTCF